MEQGHILNYEENFVSVCKIKIEGCEGVNEAIVFYKNHK